jgi:hypothetical protein
MPAPITSTGSASARSVRNVRERDLAGVAPVELGLLEHHRHVFGRHLAGDEEAHHALQRVGDRVAGGSAQPRSR